MPHERQTLLARLSSISSQIADAVQRASAKPQPAGDWPLSTILIHLWLVEDAVWQSRLKQMATQDNPHWQWTEPALDEAVARYGGLPLSELGDMFARRRGETVAHVQALTDDGWNRIGTHARYGQMGVAGLCARILEHDEEHLADLAARAK